MDCVVEFLDVESKISFKDMILCAGENVYSISRFSLRNESYGWQADDGTIRPLFKDVEELLEFTQGKFKCNINDTLFSIDLPQEIIVEVSSKIKRKIIFL